MRTSCSTGYHLFLSIRRPRAAKDQSINKRFGLRDQGGALNVGQLHVVCALNWLLKKSCRQRVDTFGVNSVNLIRNCLVPEDILPSPQIQGSTTNSWEALAPGERAKPRTFPQRYVSAGRGMFPNRQKFLNLLQPNERTNGGTLAKPRPVKLQTASGFSFDRALDRFKRGSGSSSLSPTSAREWLLSDDDEVAGSHFFAFREYVHAPRDQRLDK